MLLALFLLLLLSPAPTKWSGGYGNAGQPSVIPLVR